MDIIQRRVMKGLIPLNLHNQTWYSLNKNRNKKIFLFGGQKGAEHFLNKYGNKYCVEGILDNDTAKIGKVFNDYEDSAGRKLKYLNPDVLKDYDIDNVVIIVTSINCYDEIVEQLKAIGVKNIYVFVVLESKKLKCRIQVAYYRLTNVFKSLKKSLIARYCSLKGITEYTLVVRKKFRKVWKEYPIVNDKVFFSSYMGRDYTGHNKYITEELIKTGFPGDIVWVLKERNDDVPGRVRTVSPDDIDMLVYEMATSKIWFNDVNFGSRIIKRKGQCYIQVKHWSGVTLKKFYLDTPKINVQKATITSYKHEAKMMDYVIVGSDFDANTFKSGMRLSKRTRFLKFGSPRSDILFSEDTYFYKIHERFQIPANSKILLYAPTFRMDISKGRNDFDMYKQMADFKKVIDALEAKFNCEWYILLRLHPNVRKKSVGLELPYKVIDASEYIDSQELIAGSDAMISDYSSIMFEPAYVFKPVFLYVPDLEEYTEKERELWINIRELPFPITENDVELQEAIMKFDQNAYEADVREFFEQYKVSEDGNASKRVVDYVMKNIINEPCRR